MDAPNPIRYPWRSSGFTLVELLVVIAIMGALSAILFGGLSGAGRGAALHSAQAIVANTVAATRSLAMASGHSTRLLINADPESSERYRRMLVLMVQTSTGAWELREVFTLPRGTYVIPYKNNIPVGLFDNPNSWTKFEDTETLASSVLSKTPLTISVNSTVVETWEYIQFAAYGTMSTNGNLIVASGRIRPKTEVNVGESPIELDSADKVRGVILSSYGLARMVNDRSGF